jgi:hypothetical protein
MAPLTYRSNSSYATADSSTIPNPSNGSSKSALTFCFVPSVWRAARVAAVFAAAAAFVASSE